MHLGLAWLLTTRYNEDTNSLRKLQGAVPGEMLLWLLSDLSLRSEPAVRPGHPSGWGDTSCFTHEEPRPSEGGMPTEPLPALA